MRLESRLLLVFALLLTSGATVAGFSVPLENRERVVQVNCARRGSINAALDKHKDAASLLIKISGICTENVVVERNAVTLLGTDPAVDGVRAPLGSKTAVLIDGSRDVILQNLQVTGGAENGVRVAHSEARLLHCRVEGNQSGADVQWSNFSAEDSTFSFNTLVGLALYSGSFGRCTRCIVADNIGGSFSEGLEIGDASFINLFDSDISGSDTAIFVANSRVIVRPGSTVSASRLAVSAHAGAVVHLDLDDEPFAGSIEVENSIASVNGNQTLNPNPDGNTVGNTSHLNVGPGASLLGLNIGGFSSAVVAAGSAIVGNLSCGSGGDAFCFDPSNVTGSSTCGQCPK